MNCNDTLQFCDAAEALLTAHRKDIELHGAARPQAQREFARIAYGALEEACERMRELVAEVAELKADAELNAQMLARQCDLARDAENVATELRKKKVPPPPMLCGHPRACLVCTDEGTHHCAWCADVAKWEASLERAADVAEGFRDFHANALERWQCSVKY